MTAGNFGIHPAGDESRERVEQHLDIVDLHDAADEVVQRTGLAGNDRFSPESAGEILLAYFR